MTTTLLNNRYQIIQVLGAGGFGETFLAEDTHMPSRRRCVIKQLKPVTNDPQTYQVIQQRFEREAATLEYLGEGSSSIPKLYAYFSENGQFYLVQEWIQGQTLGDIVESQGSLQETIVREIVVNLLQVLYYVHSKGIIHRDIKPDNIILQPSSQPWGQPVLIDFGAVKETIRSVINPAGSANRSMVIGTPGYMPHEQTMGHPVYATDIYSLGLTAIYLLTGKHPQDLIDPQTAEIVWRHYAPNVSPNFAMVIDRAIKSHVSDRYGTAMQMLSDLQASPSTSPVTQATVSLSPKPVVTHQVTQSLHRENPTIPPQKHGKDWQKPALVIGSLIAGSIIGAIAIATMNRQPEAVNNVTSITTPTPEITETAPVTESPIPENTPNNSSTVPITTDQQPPTTNQQPPTTNQQPSTNNQQPPTINQQPTPTPENTEPSPPLVTSPTPSPQPITSQGQVPAFPPGTARSNVEAVLGKRRDLRGLWKNTRAVVYPVVPNQIDLGYLFDKKSGILRQTEVAFAQSVDPQLMQSTLNGMLAGQATAEIQQGLQKIQQRQLDNFQFSTGGWKGQIVRQDCDLIYISIWDSDLHDFVNPASAKKC